MRLFKIFFLSLAAGLENPGTLLNSVDEDGISFIDILISREQKVAISQYVVQQYLQEIWQGQLQWNTWQFILFFLVSAKDTVQYITLHSIVGMRQISDLWGCNTVTVER